MATAIISDIHSNIEALRAVFDDIDRRGIARVLCLGDIVGYGPNPCECVDLIMERCEWSLMGNHDFAVLYEPSRFNHSAETAAFWTRAQFESEPDAAKRAKRWEYLGDLKIREVRDGAMWVHASPRRPINEYIFPDDVVTASPKMTQIFDQFDKCCFVGHTHISGVFTDEPDFYPPEDLNGVYEFNEYEKCIINPGSVGQPRDRDNRSAYVVLEGDRVDFVRVEYDIDAVDQKIRAVPQLSDFLGARLLEGR